MKKNSLIGAAFICMNVANGFSVNNPNKNIIRRKTIDKVNDYIEKLNPQLHEAFEGIGEYHHGMLSENDALMGTPLEGKTNRTIEQFKNDISSWSEGEQAIAFGYLGAIDLNQKRNVSDDVRGEAIDFVKKCPIEHNDKGQVENKLRPKEVKEKIPLTRRVMMHGVVALLLFETRKVANPESSKKVENHFDETKHKISKSFGYEGEMTPCQYWQSLVKNETHNNHTSLC